MISRKERRIQEALGLGEDIPKTLYVQAKWWWWFYVVYTVKYKWTIDEFWRRLSYKLPKKLIYHCAIRIWAHVTTCSSGRNEAVHETTMDNAIKRWEKE